jgi:hypothetical protein
MTHDYNAPDDGELNDGEFSIQEDERSPFFPEFDEDEDDGLFPEDDGQPDEYTEWQDFMGGDDWDQGQYDGDY